MTHDYCTLSTGTRVSADWGSPRVLDMARSIGRICRWVGGGDDWYSVMLHTFVVCDLVPGYVKIYALLHDAAPECVGNDVPKPVKNEETSRMETDIFNRTCRDNGIRIPNYDEWGFIHAADHRAKVAEAWLIGNDGHRARYFMREPMVELLTESYIERYPQADLLSGCGRAAQEFIERFDSYMKLKLEYDAADARFMALYRNAGAARGLSERFPPPGCTW